jgi:hypothetical protein
MIIKHYQITKTFADAQTKYNNAVEYFKSVATDESLPRYAAVMSVLNKRMFLLEQSYNRLIKLIN